MNDILKLPPLEYFRSFIIFVESAHIVEASEKLGVSQPLLSKHLKNLEKSYGTPLFEFRGRKKVLNYLGQQLYETLQKQFSTLTTEINLTLLKNEEGRPLKIGGRREILDNILLSLDYKGCLSYYAQDSDTVEINLKNRSLDIGITQREIESDNLIRKKIWMDEFVLAFHPALKTAASHELEHLIPVLMKWRCYSYSDNTILETILSQYRIPTPLLQTSFSDWRTLVDAISSKKSWGIVPIGYVDKSNRHKYTRLPEPLNFESQFYIYYQKELSKLTWFTDLVKQIANLR